MTRAPLTSSTTEGGAARHGSTAAAGALSAILSGAAFFFVFSLGFRQLDSGLLGLWALASGILAFSRFGDAGMGVGVMRLVSIDRTQNGDAANLWAYAAAGLTVATAPMAVMSALAGLAASAYLSFRYKDFTSDVVILAVFMTWLYAILNSTTGILGGCLDGLGRMLTRYAAYAASLLALSISAPFLILHLGFWGFALSFIIQGVTYLFLILLSLLSLVRSVDLRVPVYKKALLASYSFLAGNLAIGLCRAGFEPLCKIFIGEFGTLHAVAVFDLANRLALQVRQIVASAVQPVAAITARSQQAIESKSLAVLQTWTPVVVRLSGYVYAAQILGGLVLSTLIFGRLEHEFLLANAILAAGGWLNAFGLVAYYAEMASGLLQGMVRTHLRMLAINALGGIFFGWLLGSSGVALSWTLALAWCGAELLWRYKRQHAIDDWTATKIASAEGSAILLAAGLLCFGLVNIRHLDPDSGLIFSVLAGGTTVLLAIVRHARQLKALKNAR